MNLKIHSNLGVFAFQRRQNASVNVKFGTEEHTVSHAKFHPHDHDWVRGMAIDVNVINVENTLKPFVNAFFMYKIKTCHHLVSRPLSTFIISVARIGSHATKIHDGFGFREDPQNVVP